MRRAALRMVMICILGAATAAEGSTLKLALKIEPRKTLPGIPVTLELDFTNTGPVAVEVPRYAVLQVTPENGHPFLTAAGESLRSGSRLAELWGRSDDGDARPIVVEGGGSSRRVVFHASPASPWQAGSFWMEPGRYRLRLIADAGFEATPPGDAALTLTEEYLVDPVVSNDVELTIETPKGVDAEVWHLGKQLAPRFWLADLGDTIWERYSDSEYAAYTFRKNPSRDEQSEIANATAALKKNPRGAFGDYYRQIIAAAHLSLMGQAAENDVPLALKHSQAAREMLEAIVRRHDSPIKAEAERVLDTRVLSLQQIQRRNDWSHGRSTERAKIRPLIHCVSKDGKGFKAKLGYENPNDHRIEVGDESNNFFTPPPMYRGQTEVFLPGVHKNAFTIRSDDNQPLTWTLDGTRITFPTEGLKHCDDDD